MLSSAAQAGDSVDLANGGFEEGTAGALPPGWARTEDSDAAITLEAAATGSQALRLTEGRLSQSWTADALAGRRARIRLQVQADPHTVGKVRLQARSGGSAVWSDSLEVRATAWRELALDVALPSAPDLELELSVEVLSGDGLRVDAVSVTDLGPLAPIETAPVSDEAAARMAAFSRLYGHVRWFHPADGVIEADWHSLALQGVVLAEQTSDPAVLADAWQTLLQPVAPTVQVWSGSDAPPPTPRPAADRQVSWMHLGPGVGRGSRDPVSIATTTELGNAFRRYRMDSAGTHWPEVERQVALAELDARAWSGETVRLSAKATIAGELDAVLVLSSSGGGRAASTPSLRSGAGELLLEVPSNADRLNVALELSGKGSVELTALEVAVVRPTPGRLLFVRTVSLSIYCALLGALASAGAAISRRTIGGFIIGMVALMGTTYMLGLDPLMARVLPNLHVQNIEAWLVEDAGQLAGVSADFGVAVAPGVSAAVVAAWVAGLLGIAMLRLRRLDIRGGGD